MAGVVNFRHSWLSEQSGRRTSRHSRFLPDGFYGLVDVTGFQVFSVPRYKNLFATVPRNTRNSGTYFSDEYVHPAVQFWAHNNSGWTMGCDCFTGLNDDDIFVIMFRCSVEFFQKHICNDTGSFGTVYWYLNHQKISNKSVLGLGNLYWMRTWQLTQEAYGGSRGLTSLKFCNLFRRD